MKEIGKLGGGYIPLLQTSLPESSRGYDPDEETSESSYKAFTTTFPPGFALEVLHVYSGLFTSSGIELLFTSSGIGPTWKVRSKTVLQLVNLLNSMEWQLLGWMSIRKM